MSSYNEVNDEYANENPHLMQDILRGDFVFDGMAVTDWGGSNDHVKGVACGSTLEMPDPGLGSARELVRAVKRETLDESVLDDRVEGLLTRAIAGSLHAAVKKSEKSGTPNLNVLFQYNMPFRAMAKMTGGWVPMTMAQGFADLANLHIPEGFGRIIGGFVGNLAANAAWGWKLRRIKTGKTETALPRCFPKVRSLKKRADVLYAGRSLSAVTWQGSAVYAAEPAICAVHGSAAGTLTSALGLVGGLSSAIGMLVIWPIANRLEEQPVCRLHHRSCRLCQRPQLRHRLPWRGLSASSPPSTSCWHCSLTWITWRQRTASAPTASRW